MPPFPSTDTSRVPDSQAAPASTPQETNQQREQLPPEILQVLNGALSSLRTTFPQKPPHTIQRLSELVLYPRKHYRTLPAWLRALDRVVSVSSGADVFPLSDLPPQLNNGVASGINGTEIGGILFANKSSNEIRNGYDRDALGSDESLGGALLTPIPWLKETDPLTSSGEEGPSDHILDPRHKVEDWQDRDSVDDDDFIGDPIIDTAATVADAQAIAAVAEEHANNGNLAPARRDGAVTQGELIRMEQEAGIVPVPHEDIGRIGDDEFGMGFGPEYEDEGTVHARGPDMVGTVDMGLVGGEQRQVRISSPPADDRDISNSSVDANNAQEVLQGGTHKPSISNDEGNEKEKGSETGESDQVAKDGDTTTFSTSGKKENEPTVGDDGDIVLVDADGAQDGEKKADSSGVNAGADAADATTQ